MKPQENEITIPCPATRENILKVLASVEPSVEVIKFNWAIIDPTLNFESDVVYKTKNSSTGWKLYAPEWRTIGGGFVSVTQTLQKGDWSPDFYTTIDF